MIGTAHAQSVGPGPVPNPWYFGSGSSINYDNGGVVLNKATGGPLGPGTINISGGYYINGVAIPGALGSQAANLFYASPSGSPGTPLFRAITNGDLPSSIIVSGTFSALGLVNGSGITALFSKPLPIGNITPSTGSFTTLAASAVTTNNLIDIEFPGLTSNVQGSGYPGMDGSASGLVNFIILNNPALTAANQAQATLQINRSPSGTGGSNALVPNALLVNTLVPTTDSNFEWGVSSILFNRSLVATGSQNVALAGTTFKQGSSQVGASWGILGHCEDDTGVASPTAGCVGGEFDTGVNPAVNGGADPNKQRVALHLVGTGAAGTHIGYALAIGPQGSATIDNAISVVDATSTTNFLVTGTGSMIASGNIDITNQGADGSALYSTIGYGFPPAKSGFFTSGANSQAMRYITNYFAQTALYATTTLNSAFGETGLYLAWTNKTGYQNPIGAIIGQKTAIQVSGDCASGGGVCWDAAMSLQFDNGWQGVSGNFGAVLELDPTNNSGITNPTGGANTAIYDLWLAGSIGSNPISSYLQISPAGLNGAVFAAHYGINIGGATTIDTADINTNTHSLNDYVDLGTHANGIVLGGTYSVAAITAAGNIAATNGSLTNVDLQTVVPVNGSFLGNAGASYQNCPLIGCLAGAHQFSGVYLKNTAQFDASKAEYMVTMDSNLNSGSSPQWNTSTAYVAGNEIDTTGNANNIYKETVASCTSSNTGTGPSGTGTGIVDGTCLWNYLSSNFAATKVGFFNSATTGSLSGRASWGAANDLVIGTGDTGIFKVSFEADVENLGLNTATLGINVYDVYLSGLIGTFPITANINIFHPPNGTNYASRYGILFGGGYEDSIATISDQTTHNPISIWTNGTFSSEVWGDNSTSPAAINLEGTYSAAAIYIGSTPIALAIIGGDSICMHGETAADCFKWNSTSAAIDFSAQGIEIAQSANGAVATALSSVGPTGSHTTVQEWFQIKDAAGTIRYVPGF